MHLLPPSANNCNKFDGVGPTTPNWLHLLPPSANNCNEFEGLGQASGMRLDWDRTATETVTTELGPGAGLVCSVDRLASEAGAAILAAGGSATDAAIATSAALAVTTPHMCGMGGDLFALVHHADGAAVQHGIAEQSA